MFKRFPFTACSALLAALGCGATARSAQAQTRAGDDHGYWHVGIELGELPIHGSFKPGISIGYHFNELFYLGFVYQLADSIKRDQSSFNAQATGLSGLSSSSEHVGQRAYLQARIRPHRYAPYVSLGLVFNDRDTETLRFDDRPRPGGDQRFDGPITIVQSRPAGLRPALGLGYSYTFRNRIELFTEWSGWWLRGAPQPEIAIDAPQLDDAARAQLTGRIRDQFTRSPFNTYHVFQLGAGYTF